jgi:2-haloalkanoic acid dehalogenase type II
MPAIRTAWVTFDCYGTLIDWESGISAFFRAEVGREDLLEEWERVQFHMIQGPYRRYADILADSLRQTLEAHGLEYRPDMGRRFAEALTRWRPFPETNPALEALRAKGLKLGIISNIDDGLLAETMKHFTVPFDVVVTAEQARAYKPSDAGFRLALARILRPAPEVTHVAFGDRYDLATARSCGMQVVFVNRHGKAIMMPVEAEIPDLAALPELLEALPGA